MKLIFILLIFSTTLCNADDFWKDATGVVASAEIYRLEVDSKGTVYSVSNAKLNRSIDGGDNWSEIPFESPIVFFSSLIKCDNEDNLVIFNSQGIYILESGADTARFALGEPAISEIIAVTKDNEIICSNHSEAVFVLNKTRTKLTEINLTKEYHPDLADINFHYDDNYGIIKILEFRWRSKKRNPIAYHTLDYGKTWQQFDYLPNSDIKFKALIILDSDRWLYLPEGDYSKWTLWNISKGQSIEISEEIIKDRWYNPFSINDIIYIRTDTTLYKSIDNGLSWTPFSINYFNNGVRRNDVGAFAMDNQYNIYIGNRKREFKKYSEENKLWTDINLETENIGIENIGFKNGFKKVSDKLFISDKSQFIFHSKDKGHTWDRIPLFKNGISDFDVNSKGQIIVATSDRLYYSSDFGENWNEVDTNIVKWYSSPNKVRIFEDGSIILTNENEYYHTRLYMENIKSKALTISQSVNSVVQISDGTHFGINSTGAFLANNDFSEFEYIDSTIRDKYPKNLYMSSFAVASNGNVYLVTSKGLFVAPGFVDDWTLVENPGVITSVSIDDNDYIYLLIHVSLGKDSIIYSDDNAKTWRSIGVYSGASFLAFGDGDLVISQGNVRYAKIPQTEYLYVEAKVEQDVWFDADGLISFQVKNEDNIGIESASIIIYKPWLNESDTLITDKDGIVKLEIDKKAFNSNVNTIKQIYYCAKKEGYQTTGIQSQNIFYKSNSKELTLTHINSYYPINFDKHYYLCTVDTTVSYEMVIYDTDGNVVKGTFKVENLLLKVNESFVQNDEDFATYSFNIPNDTPLGMYKLSFSANSLSNNKPTSIYETYIIVTDSIPIKYFGLGYEPYPTELISPVDDSIVGINPTLEWYRVQYADAYLLRVSKTKIFPNYYSELVFNKLVYNNSIVLEGLEDNTTYYWKVASQHGYTEYDYNMTDVWSFTTSNISDIESEYKDNILVSPNPFTDKIIVSGKFKFVELHDMKGNVLYRNSFDSINSYEYDLNTSELPSGTYFIVIDKKSYKVVKTQ